MPQNKEIEEPQLNLGQRLVTERLRLGYTQAELSKLMNWSQTRISGYENGRRSMSLEVVYEFCKKAKADVYYMIFGEYGDVKNDPNKKTLPLLDYDPNIILQHLEDENKRIDNISDNKIVTVDQYYGDRAFAIRVPDAANSPEVEKDNLAIFAPYDAEKITPGAYVLAYTEENGVRKMHIRRLKKSETRSDDQLIAANPLFPNLTYKNTKFTIIATGVELRKFSRQELTF